MQQFSEDSFRQMMEGSMGYLPETEVTVGQSWRDSTRISSGFPMKLDNTYKLISVNDGIARVTVRSEIKSLEGASINLGMASMSYSIDGIQMGSFDIDQATGMVVSSELTQKASGTLTMSGEGMPSGMTMPININSSISYSMVKLN
jgi:hypothetical protein